MGKFNSSSVSVRKAFRLRYLYPNCHTACANLTCRLADELILGATASQSKAKNIVHTVQKLIFSGMQTRFLVNTWIRSRRLRPLNSIESRNITSTGICSSGHNRWSKIKHDKKIVDVWSQFHYVGPWGCFIDEFIRQERARRDQTSLRSWEWLQYVGIAARVQCSSH